MNGLLNEMYTDKQNCARKRVPATHLVLHDVPALSEPE